MSTDDAVNASETDANESDVYPAFDGIEHSVFLRESHCEPRLVRWTLPCCPTALHGSRGRAQTKAL